MIAFRIFKMGMSAVRPDLEMKPGKFRLRLNDSIGILQKRILLPDNAKIKQNQL